MKSHKPYTEEQLQWLKDNYAKYRGAPELSKQFNKKFNETRTVIAIKSVTTNKNKLGLIKPKYWWSKEEITFILQHFSVLSNSKFYKAFCQKFGNNRSLSSIKHKARELGILKNKNTVSNSCFISKKKQFPIGYIRQNGGVLYIKTKNNRVINEFDNYEKLSSYVLKQNGIIVKPDQRIKYKDGNFKNCNLNNLLVISKSTFAYITATHLWGKGEITETDLKVGELIDKIKEKEGGQ